MVEAVLANLDQVSDYVNESLEQLGCPMKTIFQVDVAVDELFSNICFYAYPEGPGDAVIRVEKTDNGYVCITFEDSGVPFNPLRQEEPDVSLSLAERSIGGLGIFMVKKSMDDVRYVYEDGKNKLSIYKEI